MSTAVVTVSSSAASLVRLVGAVEASKDGVVTITYKKPGMVKTTSRQFMTADLIGYMTGDAGFVIVHSNEPVAELVGELSVKDGQMVLVTEAGKVRLNRTAGVLFTTTEVDADSKEARAAARASKIKVRGVKKKDKTEKKAKGDKKAKKAKTEDAPKKKKKKSKSE